MYISGTHYDQGMNSVTFEHTNSTTNRESTAGQNSKSDTVSLSAEAMELSRKKKSNENSGDASTIVDKKNKALDSALALFKEVGFEKYRIIMKTVKQIEGALTKTGNEFPAYKEVLESIENSFAESLPRSVAEAMSRLNEALKELPEEVRESVLRHLEAEKKEDSEFEKADSGFPFTLN